MAERTDPHFPFGKPYPCPDDRYQQSSGAHGHYFHQDLLITRCVYETAPPAHLDVGCHIDSCVAHITAFRPTRVLDIRPMTQQPPNVGFVQDDIMGELPGEPIDSTDSLSCLHTIEHFGPDRCRLRWLHQGIRQPAAIVTLLRHSSPVRSDRSVTHRVRCPGIGRSDQQGAALDTDYHGGIAVFTLPKGA